MNDRDDDQQGPQYAADLHRQGEVETAGAPVKPKRRWIGRLIGLVFVGMVVGAALIAVLKLANDPATGTVVANNLKKSLDPTPTPNGLLTGLYVTLNYPGVFNQVRQTKSDVNSLEQYTLGASTSYRRVITVNVKSFPSGLLTDDSSYKLRQIQPENYKPSVRQTQGVNVTIMTKLDGSEITWFWPHAGKMLVVSVTTTEIGDHVAAFSDMIMASVRWPS